MLNELIIKVDNQVIHLCPGLTVPTRQTNIPIDYCKFRSHKDIFWKVQLLQYNAATKCWKMQVVDYFVNDIKNFERQKSTREVERIAFEPFDWLRFERNLISYQKNQLLNVLHNHDTDSFFREEVTQTPAKNLSATNFYNQTINDHLNQEQPSLDAFIQAERQPIVETLKVEFSVYFTDANFKDGNVIFSKNIKEFGDQIDFKIKNDYVRAEFENIKSWFAKKLKTKKFKVNAAITTTDGKVTEVTASSPQIAMIDSELIDSIRYQRTLSLTKSPRVKETDQSLYTADEIFAEMDTDDLEENVFNQNEHEILSILLNNSKTRNRKQLEYLSGSKQAEKSKLRFTLHPNFGFLFFIEGKKNNHFVWELLNSHATYIWSTENSEKEIELQYKRIEASINTIREVGREQYKRAYRQNQHDSDLVLSIIEHEDITSKSVDGFVKWKHKLNEKIT